MDNAVLVDRDVRRGHKIVERLRSDGLAMDGAFWRHASERDRWTLVIASPEARNGVRKLFLRAAPILSYDDLSMLDFVAPEDGPFQAVREAYGAASPYGKRVRNSMTRGGAYVDDAFVYQI